MKKISKPLNKIFIPVTNLPKPQAPKHWQPTPEEIKRNPLLRDAYGVKEENK